MSEKGSYSSEEGAWLRGAGAERELAEKLVERGTKLALCCACASCLFGAVLLAWALAPVWGALRSQAQRPLEALPLSLDSLCPCSCSQSPNVDATPETRRLVAPVSVQVSPVSVQVLPVSVEVAPVSVTVAPISVAPFSLNVAPVVVAPVVAAVAPVAEAGGPPPNACLSGDRCEFGKGWCTKKGYARNPVEGECQKRTCSGPANVVFFPEQTCSTPDVHRYNITSLLGRIPGMLLNKLQDVEALNANIKQWLEKKGISRFVVEVGADLVQGLVFRLSSVEAVWLVGCWPPQRYAVVTGAARLPRGVITTTVAGWRFPVTFTDYEFRFANLRANIACHGGFFVLEGIGQGVGSEPMKPEIFEATGSFDAQCDQPWSLLCVMFNTFVWPAARAGIMAALPSLVAEGLEAAVPVILVSGCPDPLHNTLAKLPYSSRACCEDAFALDADGCLVGGQFNGRVPGMARPVSGVTCVEDATAKGTYHARCETLPGGYYETSPGACREADVLPGSHPVDWGKSSPAWHTMLGVLLWAELLFLLALCCCCCGGWGLCCGMCFAVETPGDDLASSSTDEG